MFWLDEGDKLTSAVSKANLGILDKVRPRTPAYVMAKGLNMPESVFEELRERPAYLSADHST